MGQLERQIERMDSIEDQLRRRVNYLERRISDDEHVMRQALRALKHATPNKRNGPCCKAIGILRQALNLPPMKPGGSAADGLE